MTKREMLKGILTNPSNVYHYLLGNYRYKLYYKNTVGHMHIKPFFMRQHIFEQINYRIRVMNPECYNSGSCIKCGCSTTALQMANKRCDGICYPTMMNKKDWDRFKIGSVIWDGKKDGVWIKKYKEDKQHNFYKETPTGYVQQNTN